MRVHEIRDLDASEVGELLSRAHELADGSHVRTRSGVVGLLFLEPSLRTRVGFTAAAHRVGAHPIEVVERRSSERSMPESLDDTVRVLSGYCDALVVRGSRRSRSLADAALTATSWLNAGDDHEHPSQALIDLFAIERLAGPLAVQRIALVGDLRMRAARSLLAALTYRRPQSVVAVTDVSLEEGLDIPGELTDSITFAGMDGVRDASVVIAVGIPHGAAVEAVRTRLRIDRTALAMARDDAVILSPMPVIDEIASASRDDHRMHYLEQSDLAQSVRTALLERLLR